MIRSLGEQKLLKRLRKEENLTSVSLARIAHELHR